MTLPPYLDADGRLIPGAEVPNSWERYKWLTDDGDNVMCGLLPRELPCGALVPEWFETGEDVPPLPKSEWASTPDMRPYEWNNRYQNGYPSCALNATCGTAEFIMARDGRAKVPLDWHKYWIETTGGRGGCAIDRALQHAMQKGIPIKDTSDRLFITEAWDVNTLDEFAVGLQRGAMAVGCHDVHAECVVGLTMEGSTPYVQMVNSHYYGDNANKNWHMFRLDRIELRSYGAMLIREVEIRSADLTGLVDAKG